MAGKKAEKNQISDWDLGQEEESLDFLKEKQLDAGGGEKRASQKTRAGAGGTAPDGR